LIAETNQAGQMLAEYIYLGDQLLAMIKPGESVYYFHNDHLGTPQVLTNDSQTIAWKAAYTPFGDAVASIQTVENPFRFPGQYYDPKTGLHYNYFRYYNPQTGRYITPDPIGLEGGINLFAYVQNQPINKIDPLGLQNVPELPPIIPLPRLPKLPFPPTSPKKPPPEECPKEEDDRCEIQAQADEAICRRLSDPGARARCFASANERYGACRAGRPLPPLVIW
jgi:RHS repeat-associated protein